MRIVLLTTSYFPEYNGASLRIDGLSKGLHAHGDHMVIIAPGIVEKREERPECTVYYTRIPDSYLSRVIEHFTKFHPARFWAYYKKMRSILKAEKVDAVHARQPLDNFLIGYLLKRRYRLPWVTEAHKILSFTDYQNGIRSYISYRIVAAFESWFINRSDRVITLTRSGFATLRKHGIRTQPVVVENALHARKLPKGAHAANMLLYFGSIRESEGLETLLYAFKKIHAQRPKVKLVLVGGGNRKPLEELARKLGIDSAVTFTGELTLAKLDTYLVRAYAFVYPRKDIAYHHDIVGMKIFDTVYAQLPIVTADIGELATLIREKKIGLLTQPGDADDFAEKTLMLLKDKKRYAQIVRNLKKLAVTNTWPRVTKPLHEVYQTLVKDADNVKSSISRRN